MSKHKNKLWHTFIGTRVPAFQTVKDNVASSLSILTCAVVALAFGLVGTDAHAEGGLESQKGGLFHRKGWIHPEIHRRKTRPAQTASTTRSQPRPAPTQRTINRQKQSQATRRTTRKASSRPRIVSVNRRRIANNRKTRIPARIVQKVEKDLKRSERRSARRNRKKVRVASLGKTLALPKATRERRKSSITGGGGRVQWVARSGCLNGRLKAAINYVARNYGRVRVNSTCRSRRHNRRVGGARNSLHLSGRAADIRIFGNVRKAARYLRRVAGGFKHYGGGLFHIDTGPKRSW